MKRRDNGRSHAAVDGFQLGKRTQGRRVTYDAGDLPPAGRIGGLALCAGFWLGHGSCAQRRAKVGHRNLLFAQLHRVRRAERASEAIAAGRAEEDAAEAAVLSGCDGLHFVLRAGPIPTMCQSCRITSDASTTVRRVAA